MKYFFQLKFLEISIEFRCNTRSILDPKRFYIDRAPILRFVRFSTLFVGKGFDDLRGGKLLDENCRVIRSWIIYRF